MIDKDTALGLIQLLRIATDEENVPYETRELKESALSALDDVLERAESEVNDHYSDNYRHHWHDTCKLCEAGILPDKRQSREEHEAREKAAYDESWWQRSERARQAHRRPDEDDPENPFRG